MLIGCLIVFLLLPACVLVSIPLGVIVCDRRLWHVLKSVARTLKKLRISKGDYLVKQRFPSIAPLFKMGTSLKEKNLLPEGANYFL